MANITGTSGNDLLVGTGAADVIDGLAGDDTVAGRAGSDLITGGLGADSLQGEDGNDTLIGGSGAANEDPGDDTLVGGNDDDLVRMQCTLPDSGAFIVTSGRALLDGGAGNDRIEVIYHFSGLRDQSVSIFAGEGSDTIDASFADFPWGRSVAAIHGDDGDDAITVTGSSADHRQGGVASVEATIEGGSGNDTITTRSDANVDGGAGRDTLYVFESGSTWSDHIDGGTSWRSLVDGGADDDRIFLSGSAHILNINAMGGTGDDLIVSDAAGNNFYYYSNGVILAGGLGNDTITLGAAAAASSLDGGDGNDSLQGAGRDDRLSGGAGHDTLLGGAGADTLAGGAGSDVYFVDAGDLISDEASGDGVDIVYSTATFTLGTGLNQLFLTGGDAIDGAGNDGNNVLAGNGASNRLSGAGGADLLYGNSGNDFLDGGSGNDTLSGGGGADSLAGGAGSDIYFVDAGDIISGEASGDGVDIVYSTGSFTLGTGLNQLFLTGGDAIDGTGNDGDNVLAGNRADNRLAGLGGNDALYDEAGDDTLDGGSGDDTLQGGSGADRFVFAGENGADVIRDWQDGADRIDLTAYRISFAALGISVAGGDTLIDLGAAGGGSIRLAGVTSGIDAADFIFA